MSEQTIPVVELGRFGRGDAERAAVVQTVGRALEEVGFLAVTDHGVDPELIRRAYAAAEAFFSLPEAAKVRYEDLALKGQRGFTSFGREHARDHPHPDLKEFWHVGRDLPAGHLLGNSYLANLWPDEVPEFHPAFAELYRQLDRCASRLLDAVSLYLGEPQGLIGEMARDGNSVLRIIHYPPIPEGVPPASMRAAPHEDINLITLLCEATAGGLELLTREGEWLPIRALPGQIIVDSGDMLQNLTNGVLRSTTHRVTNPGNSRERRFSMPFFVHPRAEVSLAPLRGCVRLRGGAEEYPRITAGAYLEQRLREIGLA